MRVGWTTDIHLNFVEPADIFGFGKKIASKNVEALIVTGDIAEADCVKAKLALLHEGFRKPIHFVLGNHDAYGSSISAVMASMRDITNPELNYLTHDEDAVELTPTCALVGDDGWYDGRNGDLLRSNVLIGDMEAVHEIREAYLGGGGQWVGPVVLQRRLEILGDAAVERVRPKIEKALEKYEKVIFATHVPPYAEAAWHKGAMSDRNWLPFFSCKAMGQMLSEVFSKFENRKLLVLCGHSHSPGNIEPLPGLVVLTGGAKYRHPHLNRVIDIGASLTMTRSR